MSEIKVSCEALRATEEICRKFHNDPGELISILHETQNTLGNARYLMEKHRKGELDYHVVEVMACPGGCIDGADQPYHHGDVEIIKARAKAIYAEDAGKPIRKSHENPDIQQLYKVFLGEPLGELSEKLLHTHYFNKAQK